MGLACTRAQSPTSRHALSRKVVKIARALVVTNGCNLQMDLPELNGEFDLRDFIRSIDTGRYFRVHKTQFGDNYGTGDESEMTEDSDDILDIDLDTISVSSESSKFEDITASVEEFKKYLRVFY